MGFWGSDIGLLVGKVFVRVTVSPKARGTNVSFVRGVLPRERRCIDSRAAPWRDPSTPRTQVPHCSDEDVWVRLHRATLITNERSLRRSQVHASQHRTTEPCLNRFWLHRVQPPSWSR